MRDVATAERIREFMKRLGASVRKDVRIYLTGGATAVLHGWRSSTVDVDIKIVPDSDEVYQALPKLKEDLQLNVELASPDQFVPALPGWESRSKFIEKTGSVHWFHYDLYGQALSKVQRFHERDQVDVREMISRGLVDPARLRELFERVGSQLVKYPAIDPDSLQSRVNSL